MHITYNFHFLNTVSAQLKQLLDDTGITILNERKLENLNKFQIDNDSQQGVYLLYHMDQPVYLGKAENVADRLAQHLRKLRGRLNIQVKTVGYKAILLDKSMSTAANENILIEMFKQTHEGMWNGKGFGPKDPGKNRDTTKISWFDINYPIIPDYPIDGLTGSPSIREVVEMMKIKLPYHFRYNISADVEENQVNLVNVKTDAKSLLTLVVNTLGKGWKGVILSYGMILYKTDQVFPNGIEILPKKIKQIS
jgi:predicted GIY-YIG superfamily endonuclease